jgi:diguanylate cyclase (GGDEF)-like protein
MLASRSRPLALAAALLLAAPLSALDPALPIWRNVQDDWDVDDGLPQSTVNALAQTPDGYLWVGTYDGLARFDGLRFDVFRPSAWPALGGGAVRALLVDRRGRLWIGTGAGLAVRETDGCLRAIPGTDAWTVRALAEGPDGSIWIGTGRHGLARLVGQAAPVAADVAPGVRAVASLLAEPDGTLWIGSDGSGLWRRDREGAVTRVDTGATTLCGALLRDSHGDLWAGCAGGGLLHYHGAEREMIGSDALGATTVFALLEDRAGSLWIAPGGGGLLRRRGDTLERHSTATGLPYDGPSALLEDREGALWIGMAAAGLVRLQGGSFSTLSASDGLPQDSVYSVVEDARGDLWAASNNGTLARRAGRRFVGETIPGLTPKTPLRSLAVAPDGDLWVATYGGGVARRSESDGSWRAYDHVDGLPSDNVRGILVDAAGTVWAATVRGLGRYDGTRWSTLDERDGLPTPSITSLAAGADGTVWFGMDGGGLGRRAPDGRLTFLARKDGLASDIVLAVRPGRDGKALWIGTNGGLSRLEGGEVTSWTVRDGLPSDNVAQVGEDGLGFLWIGTGAGVARVAVASMRRGEPLPVRIFGRGDGMVSSQATAPSNGPLLAHDGQLWFPTRAGLAVVDPRHLTRDTIPPVVHVEHVAADGTPLPMGATVTVPRGTARFEIQYTGICTRAAQLVRFRHRLAGFDRDWVDAGPRRVAYYPAVPPGAYRFEVEATNADGASAATSLDVVLPRRFWETRAFQAGSILALVALVLGAVKARTSALEARQRALEATVAERTEELRHANLALEDRNELLAALSLVDPLTGLANRRRFDEALLEEWRRAVRAQGWLSLVLADIDAFKQFNDSLGHPAGDDALRRVGAVLVHTAHRAGELACRWGGEEFAVLLPGSGPEDAHRVGELVREAVAGLGVAHPASQVAPIVTVSLGTASIRPRMGGDPQALVHAADAALYRAKQGGRDRVETEVVDADPTG